MGNMETLESGTLYIKNDDGSMTPLGKIFDAELEISSLNNDSVGEARKMLKSLSLTAAECSGTIIKFSWHLRKYSINNWRRNHGLPMIRKRRK